MRLLGNHQVLIPAPPLPSRRSNDFKKRGQPQAGQGRGDPLRLLSFRLPLLLGTSESTHTDSPSVWCWNEIHFGAQRGDQNKNIEASVHFDPPLHQQKYLKKYSKKLVNTEKLSKEIITLPIYPKLNQIEIKKILKTIKNWYKRNKKWKQHW